MHTPISIVTVTAEQLQALIDQAVERAVERTLAVSWESQSKRLTHAPLKVEGSWPDRMSRREAAQYLGLAAGTLEIDVTKRRLRIPMVKAGRRAIYERAELDKWIAARRVN